jgi:hypothetical protein
MATPKFDTLLTELMPVGAEFEPWAGSLRSGIGSAPGGGYLIGNIADSLGLSKEDVIDKISKALYDKVFPGGVNPANSEDQYRNAIKDALAEVIADIKDENPELKVPGADAVKGYTARVISQLGQAVKEYGSKVSPEKVKSAVVSAEEGDASEDSEVEVSDEAPEVEKPAKAAPASYNPRRDYYLKNREEIPSGTLKGDLDVIYDRLSGIAGEVVTGEDIENTLRKSGTEQGKITSYLRKLVDAGVLEPAAEEGSGGGAALETGDENMRDVEKSTFDRELGAAYKDYLQSGGGRDYGVDFG